MGFLCYSKLESVFELNSITSGHSNQACRKYPANRLLRSPEQQFACGKTQSEVAAQFHVGKLTAGDI